MSLVPEIPLFGIIVKILDLEDENIEFSKNIFQAHLNKFLSSKQKLKVKIFQMS